jgi:small subunit ribosomal protein S13
VIIQSINRNSNFRNIMRILGITLPNDKRVDIALTTLYGIGISRAHKILDEVKVEYGTKTKDIPNDQEDSIRKIVEGLKIEGNLKREVSANIKRLKDIKAYRGVRHQRQLPTKGQRTKTNSRTVRGNVRKTMSSGRRKESKT